MLEQLAEWWNAVELWLAQLWFPAQILLVMLVLLPACWAAAWLIDHAVDRVSTAFRRGHRETAPPATGVAKPGSQGAGPAAAVGENPEANRDVPGVPVTGGEPDPGYAVRRGDRGGDGSAS